MQYRTLGRTGWSVSEIGIGAEHFENKPPELAARVISAAMEYGANIIDVFMSEPNVRTNIGAALAGRRQDVYVQGHFGSIYENGQYARSRDVKKAIAAFEDLLRRLGTDYIDIGMLHYVDADFDEVFHTDFIEAALRLKEQGKIRCIGASTHIAQTGIDMVQTGLVDVLMFSVNPAFDTLSSTVPLDDMFGLGGIRFAVEAQRAELYSLCEQRGVGITSMKTLCGGLLLSPELSPFGIAMTPEQCISYALERPAVASALIGYQSVAEVERAMRYFEATPAERDYASVLANVSATEAVSARCGLCVYCNHCLPCPVNIDIAAVNRCLDTYRTGGEVTPQLAEGYGALTVKPDECIECGSCETACPFGVPVIERMLAATEAFE